jgi:hypothetical protein
LGGRERETKGLREGERGRGREGERERWREYWMSGLGIWSFEFGALGFCDFTY